MLKSRVISPIVVLGVAVLVCSTAAISIRFAQIEGVGSLAISAWRLCLASAVLIAIVLARRELRDAVRTLDWRAWVLCAASGVFLGAHMASWITSLAYTSVASSTALVTTNPIWLAIFAYFILRERIGRWMLVGIACAILGSGFIFLADANRVVGEFDATNPTLGNALALLAALLVCGYLLLGRYLGRESVARQAINVVVYATLVYSFAALALLLMAVLTSTPMSGYTALGWWCLIALALGPQLFGHTAINWSLKHFAPAFVAVAILGEPIGSAIWAYFLFDEKILPLQFAGFVLLLSGIAISSREART